MGSRAFDNSLMAVVGRPRPALVALLIGVLVGFTGGVAISGGGDSPENSGLVTIFDPSEVELSGKGDAGKKRPNATRKSRARRAQSELDPGQSKGFALAASRAGQVIEKSGMRAGAVIIPLSGDRVYEAGDVGSYQAWSTMKIPAIATFLSFKAEPSKKDLDDIKAAITQSSNEAVRRLYQQILKVEDVAGANSRLVSMLASGDADISGLPSTIDPGIRSVAFGQSKWAPESAAKFFQTLACGQLAISTEHARYMLTQMAGLTDGRWGAVTTFPSDRVFAKGGWGDSGGWTVSQIAIVGRRTGAFVLAMMSEPSSYAAGQSLLNKIAGAVKGGAPVPKPGGRLPGGC